jgi:hypothetical protein
MKYIILSFAVFAAIIMNSCLVDAQAATGLDDLKNATVKINVYRNNQNLGEGAGVVVGRKDNYAFILTAYHVIKGADKLEVKFNQRKWETFIGKPHDQCNENLDIAVIIVKLTSTELRESFPDLIRGDLSVVEETDAVTSIGHPLGSEWQANKNSIQKLDYEGDHQKLTTTNVGLKKGNSGGPVFNEQLELIGIVTEIDAIRAVATKLESALESLKYWGIPYNLIGTGSTVSSEYEPGGNVDLISPVDPDYPLELGGIADITGQWSGTNEYGTYIVQFVQNGNNLTMQEYDQFGNTVGYGSGTIYGTSVSLIWTETFLGLPIQVEGAFELSTNGLSLVGQAATMGVITNVILYRL